MKVYLLPQVNNEIKTNYIFDKESLKISINGITESFDFTNVPNGVLDMYDHDTGKLLIDTSLDPFPIVKAERKDGVLYLELINLIDSDASNQEKFSDWIDV